MNTMLDGEHKLLFIMNPKAGTMQASKHLSEIIQAFSDAGCLTTVMLTAKQGDARDFAIKYGKEVHTIVCAGGDGTLNEVIDGVITSGANCKIGYIPAGSTNDFASSVGLSKDVVAAAKVAATGNTMKLDVGDFNGRFFSYVASFGAFTSTSYKVPQNIKNIIGHNAYVLQGIRDIINIKSIHARIIADEGTENQRVMEGDYIFGAVCNSTSVGGMLKLDSFGVDMNDGKMEVLLIHSPKNLIELNSIVRALLTGDLDSPEINFFSVESVRMQIQEDTHWTLDGEYEEGADEIKIKTINSAIDLIV